MAEEKEEKALERLGGTLIDPRRIMFKDKIAFVLGALWLFLATCLCRGRNDLQRL